MEEDNRTPVQRCRVNRKPIVYFQIVFHNIPSVNTVEQTWSSEFTLRGWTSGLKGGRVWLSSNPAPLDIDDGRWHDPELTRPMGLDDWEPRIRISNLVSTESWMMSKKWVSDEKSEMQFKWTIAGNFLEQLEIHDFPRDFQSLQLKITSPTPQFCLRPGGERNVMFDGHAVHDHHIPALLDELASLEQRMLANAMDRRVRLSEAEGHRRTALLQWRRGDDRVQRILRLAPHFEVADDDPQVWEGTHNGLTDHDRTSIHKIRNVVRVEHFGMSNIWDLECHVRMHSSHSKSTDSGNGEVKPFLNISLLATRRPEYYLWFVKPCMLPRHSTDSLLCVVPRNIEVPMFVLTSLTGATWAIPDDDVADRLSVSLALVLTAVAYKLTVAESIPQVAYLTMLDRFIGLCFVHITLAAVENSIVPALNHPTLDTTLGIVWAVLWVATSLWYALAVRHLWKKRTRALESYALSAKIEEYGPGTAVHVGVPGSRPGNADAAGPSKVQPE